MTRALLLAAGLAFGAVPPVALHPTGAIRLESDTVAAGATLGIRGTSYKARVQMDLELRGTLKTFRLPQVKTDATGAFAIQVTVPADVTPGAYMVTAVASDGDDAGDARVVITAAAAPAALAGLPAMPGMGDHAMLNGPEHHPSDAMMTLAIRTSLAERLTMFSLIGLAFASGIALLVIARRHDS